MDSNERATYLLKKIWEDNDLDAVECFRTLIKNESLILYREKQEDLNYRPLFYHGEPIVHEYSLSPLAYEIDIKRLISLIGKMIQSDLRYTETFKIWNVAIIIQYIFIFYLV